MLLAARAGNPSVPLSLTVGGCWATPYGAPVFPYHFDDLECAHYLSSQHFSALPPAALQQSITHRISTLNHTASVAEAVKAGDVERVARLRALREEGASERLTALPTEPLTASVQRLLAMGSSPAARHADPDRGRHLQRLLQAHAGGG